MGYAASGGMVRSQPRRWRAAAPPMSSSMADNSSRDHCDSVGTGLITTGLSWLVALAVVDPPAGMVTVTGAGVVPQA